MDKQTLITRVRELQANYKVNEQVAAKLAHINLIAVVGPTGAGKSTVVRQSGLPFVIGDTTRPQREGEIQGRDYNFRTDLDNLLAEIQRGEFVQFVVQRETEIYGTKASSYPSSGSCAMSILATVIPVFKTLGFGSVTPVYIVPPSHTEWMHRISAHRDKDLEARLMEAKESLASALQDPSYIFILNDSLDSAVTQLRGVAAGKVDNAASNNARLAATVLYEHLQHVIR